DDRRQWLRRVWHLCRHLLLRQGLWPGRGGSPRTLGGREGLWAGLTKGAQINDPLADLFVGQAGAPERHCRIREAVLDPQEYLAIGVFAGHHVLGEIAWARVEPNAGWAIALAASAVAGNAVGQVEPLAGKDGL